MISIPMPCLQDQRRYDPLRPALSERASRVHCFLLRRWAGGPAALSGLRPRSQTGRLLHPAAQVDLGGPPFGEVERVGIAAIDVASVVGGDAFERAELLGLRNVGRDLAVLGAADPDPLPEARIVGRGRLRVGDVHVVVLIDIYAARPAEPLPCG